MFLNFLSKLQYIATDSYLFLFFLKNTIHMYFLMDIFTNLDYIKGKKLNILKNEPMTPFDSVIDGFHFVSHSILKSLKSSGAMVVSIVSSPSITPLTILCFAVYSRSPIDLVWDKWVSSTPSSLVTFSGKLKKNTISD